MNKWLTRNGIAYVAALGMVVIMMTLGLAYVLMVRTEMDITEVHHNTQMAFYYAENGLHHSIGDIVNGGTGIIPSTDQDLDGDIDYSVNYSSGKITATSSEGVAVRTLVAEVTASPWTGAFMVGGNINPAMNLSFSVVNGNVDAGGFISSNFTSQQTINGTVTPSNSSLVIPTTDTTASGPWATSADYTHANCSSLGLTPPPGIHYVDGDCVINFSNTGPFILNGSLIVNGDINIQSVATGFNITALGDNPAMVANAPSGQPTKGNITLTTINAANITGMLYASRNITFNTWEFFGGHDLTNTAMVAGGDVGLNTVARTNYTFNANMNPPNFSGGGGTPTINLWRGHPE